MKKIVIFLLLLMPFQTSIAQSSNSKLIIWKNDGSKVTYALDEHPITTFTSDGVTITTNSISVSYPIDKIQKYTYEGIASAIATPKADNDILISQNNNEFTFSNLKEGSSIQVYSVDGLLLHSILVAEKNVLVSLDSYPCGVYVIKADNVSYKVIKK